MRDALDAISNTADDLLRNVRKLRNGELCAYCNRPAHPGNCTGADPAPAPTQALADGGGS